MERRNKKEIPGRKVEMKLKDGGDLKSVNKTNNNIITEGVKIIYPEEYTKKFARIIYPDGDSNKVHPSRYRPERRPAIKSASKTARIKEEKLELNEIAKALLNKRLVDLKRVRERYNARVKNQNNNEVRKPNEAKREEKKNAPIPEPVKKPEEPKIKLNEPKETKEVKKDLSKKKSAVVKTITTKNGDYKTFKSISFVEPKQLTPLRIKIPIDNIRKRASKVLSNASLKALKSLKSKESGKMNSKDNIVHDKKHSSNIKYRRRRVSSKDSIVENYSRTRSPPTEVARWVTNTEDRHTKPYYDAWVDTALVATSKYSKKDQMKLEKESILRTIKNNYRRSSDIINYLDERYTGRIRIKQR